MPVTTLHPDYANFKKQRDRVLLCLKGQDAIKDADQSLLPATTGMKKNWDVPLASGMGTVGQVTYEGYKQRTRFYAKTSQARDNIIGVMFGESNEADDAEIVTNDGLSALQLAKEMTRDILQSGRSVLVVDAPTEGGQPYITRYAADALINWKTSPNNKNELMLAVLSESIGTDAADEFSHDTESRYRVYRLVNGAVTLGVYNDKDEEIEPVRDIALNFIPVIAIGSIDCSPEYDPIPLLPIAECCISAYQKDAEYAQARFMSAHPTPAVKGVSDTHFTGIASAGIGSGAIWHLGDQDGADAFFLETSGNGLEHLKNAVDDELRQADYLSTRLMQAGSAAESAQALQIRDDSQKASIYMIAEAVAEGLNRAIGWRAEWANEKPDFISIALNKPAEQPNPQMITSLIAGINGDLLPRSTLYSYLRDTKMTALSDDEIVSEIESAPMPKAAAMNGI